MKAFGIWLAAVIVFSLVMGIWFVNGEELEVFVAFLVWMAGMAILIVIGLVAVVGAGATKVLQEEHPSVEDKPEEGQSHDAAPSTPPARSSPGRGWRSRYSNALLGALAIATVAGLIAGAWQWSQRDYAGKLEWHDVADPYLSSGRDDGGFYTYFILCDEGSPRDGDNPQRPAADSTEGSAEREVRHGGNRLTEAERAVEAARYRCMESRPVAFPGPYFEDAGLALIVGVAVYFLIAALAWTSRALSRA